MKNLGLYIHIPFCLSKCAYCDFVSFCVGEGEQREYLEALFCEIDLYKREFKNKTFDTLYIGGGTPSAVFDGFIESLVQKVFSSFKFSSNFEFTIEVNPSSFSEKKLEEYLRAGVNRISVGVQCINEKVTSGVGRKQTKSDVANVFKILNRRKFDNISADIMLALPNETDHDILDTIDFFLTHGVKHISAYSLQLEAGTPLFSRVQAGESVPSADEARRQYDLLVDKLKKAGFERYEVSNFARVGYESKHNQKYWDGTNYLGLGVSAHSFYQNVRFFNTSNLHEYISKFKNLSEKNEEENYLSVSPLRGLTHPSGVHIRQGRNGVMSWGGKIKVNIQKNCKKIEINCEKKEKNINKEKININLNKKQLKIQNSSNDWNNEKNQLKDTSEYDLLCFESAKTNKIYNNKTNKIKNSTKKETNTNLKQILKVAPIEGYEILDEKTKKIERIMLALRTSAGLDIEAFNREFNCEILSEKESEIHELLSLNAIEIKGKTLKITNDFFYLSNAIIKKLI